MRFSGLSDKGMVRPNNEDSFYIGESATNQRMLFVIADGMGGHNAGEVASSIAVEIMKKTAEEARPDMCACDILRKGAADANNVIYSTAATEKRFSNMGTTITAAMFENNELYIVNVGDSRAYLYSGGALKQATQDHSYVQELMNEGLLTKQEADTHPQRNYITRSLGVEDEVEADIYCLPWKSGDRLLLCTDGLTQHLSDDEIRHILSSFSTPEFTADAFVKLANARGGSDNITVIAVFNDDVSSEGGNG